MRPSFATLFQKSSQQPETVSRNTTDSEDQANTKSRVNGGKLTQE